MSWQLVDFLNIEFRFSHSISGLLEQHTPILLPGQILDWVGTYHTYLIDKFHAISLAFCDVNSINSTYIAKIPKSALK
jgi:hypothetical protein